jgi:hypothetical protein
MMSYKSRPRLFKLSQRPLRPAAVRLAPREDQLPANLIAPQQLIEVHLGLPQI